ncbi:MAG: hypothetical protein RR500_09030 [Bacilli bacterium]
MKKIIAILLSCILGATVFVGCGDKKETSKESDNQNVKVEEKQKNPIDELKNDFKKAGLKVGDNETLAFDMVGATSGEKFNVNGEPIEVYYYDKDKLNDEGKKYLEEAKKGSMSISGMNFPVTYNKLGLVLTRVNEHKDKTKILEVFNSFS